MIVRAMLVAGRLAIPLVFTATAGAKNVPRAKLVKDADLVCSYENGKLAQFKQADLPDASVDPSKATSAQIKGYAKWLRWNRTILADEVERVFALGTPSERAARVAWNRWRALKSTVALPAYAAAISGSRRGDAKALVASLSRVEKYNAEAAGLRKTIGFKVCQWSS